MDKAENSTGSEHRKEGYMIALSALLHRYEQSLPYPRSMMNSRCTMHMTKDLENFYFFIANNNCVQAGNKQWLDTQGIVTVVVDTVMKCECKTITFHDVLYVPQIHYNLLQVSCIR